MQCKHTTPFPKEQRAAAYSTQLGHLKVQLGPPPQEQQCASLSRRSFNPKVFSLLERSEHTPMASKASKSDWASWLDRNCANCHLFLWEQPAACSLTSPLTVCTGCRKISYCSKDCQDEHWSKVHKRHCRVFSGLVGLEGTVVHNKETCNHCMMQEAAGRKVFKENNPNYICLYDPSNPRAKSLQEIQLQYPFPLKAGAEQEQSRREKIVVLLQRLLLKIKLTKQPVSRLYPKEVDVIGDELLRMGMGASVNNVIYPKARPVAIVPKLKELLSPDLLNLPPSGRYQMWDTFLMLVALLDNQVFSVELDGLIKKPEKSLPKDQRRVSQMVRESSYLKVVDQILELLEEKLVTQEDLAAAVCDGNVKRECGGCSKDICIKAVSTFIHKIAGVPSVFLQPGQTNLFSCGAKACEDQIKVRPEVSSWNFAIGAAANMLQE